MYLGDRVSPNGESLAETISEKGDLYSQSCEKSIIEKHTLNHHFSILEFSHIPQIRTLESSVFFATQGLVIDLEKLARTSSASAKGGVLGALLYQLVSLFAGFNS